MVSFIELPGSFAALDLATWNRPRSSQELQDFIDLRHSRLVGNDEVE